MFARRLFVRAQLPSRLRLPFSSLTPSLSKPLPPRPIIPESSITESFLKGTGPGGQKINKTSSAVQLKHLPTGIVVKCQATRSREQNRKTARRLLGERLEELEKGSEARTRVKVERVRARKASAEKKKRRKYRKLEEEKGGKGGGSGTDAEEAGLGEEGVANEAVEEVVGGERPIELVEEQRRPP